MTDTESTTTGRSPGHLTEENLSELKALLERERSEIVAETSETEGIETDLSDDPGTRLSEREELETINSLQFAQLALVDAALARIEEGTYGACQECGVDIPFERLEALPATPYCIDCQARQVG